MDINITRLLNYNKEVISIFENANVSWEFKYTRIFTIWNKNIKPILNDLNDSLDWYDPDTSYEEDVTYFVKALQEKCNEYAIAYSNND